MFLFKKTFSEVKLAKMNPLPQLPQYNCSDWNNGKMPYKYVSDETVNANDKQITDKKLQNVINNQGIQNIKDIVFGFLNISRNVNNEHKKERLYPSIIGYVCLCYYYIEDYYDEIDSRMSLEKATNCLYGLAPLSNKNAILHQSIDRSSGCVRWKFEIEQICDKGWGICIGICNGNYKNISSNRPYSLGDECGYGLVLPKGKLVKRGGISYLSKQYIDANKISRFKKGDIIEMYLNMNKLELGYVINGIDCGVAYKVEDAKYKAAINMYAGVEGLKLL